MNIQEHLHAHLSSANCLLTKLQSEMPRQSKEWQQLIAAIAYVRAAQAIAQFLPPMEVQIEEIKPCTPIE